MRINCLSCGFKIDLDDVYDDFDGLIKCLVCGASLHLTTVGGKILSLAPVSRTAAAEGGEAETTVVKQITVETVKTS